MKKAHQALFRGMGFMLLAGTLVQAWADTKQNPYETIPVRNPFGLKPPPDPSTNVVAAPPAPPAPLATVEVTGITSILSSKRALLEIVPGPGKPMIKPILSEGERIESVEVVAINVEKNEVTIKNGLITTNLTFKVAKAAPTPAAPPPGTFPGVIPQPAQPLQPLNQGAAVQPPAGRNGVMVAGGAPPINPAGNLGADGNFRSIPSRNIRTTAPQAGQPAPSLEEHYIMTELNRGTHNLPLPPTPLNPNPQFPTVPGGIQNQNPQYPNQQQNPANPTPNSPYQLHRSIGGVPQQQLQLPVPGGN